MIRKLTVLLLTGVVCLLGLMTTSFAEGVYYDTLQGYERLTGNKIEEFYEAPMLRTLVAAGELPPVEERLPKEPLVVEPVEEIGKYGGSLKTAKASPAPRIWTYFWDQPLFMIAPDLKSIDPNIAKGYDWSDDLRTLTVYLREGMKWSDGYPFTADDFLFWFEDIFLNDELNPVKSQLWSPGGEMAKVKKIDDYTVRYQFAIRYPSIMAQMTYENRMNVCFAPKHYLKQYHINYNPKANEAAKEEKFDSWWQGFNYHYPYAVDKREDVN
ncbi:unnamed protein product, partial [marine sediment metagenome]